MNKKLLQKIENILACPYCGGSLSQIINSLKCLECCQEYFYSNHNQLNLRLQRKKKYGIQFEIGGNLFPENFNFNVLKKKPLPEVDFSGIKVPWHLSEELISYFPKAQSNNDFVLDLGCGNTIHQEICEHAGFHYVGLDYDSPKSPILGDAHALPFKNDSFQFILSVAVLEHIQNPFIMMSETLRVLKPGGKLIGTVAFLEPFHSNSFYHHTHLGTLNSLKSAGFEIEFITPSSTWSVLIAQAQMSLFPKLPKLLSKILVLPLYWLHRIWWRIGYFFTQKDYATENNRLLLTTGMLSFMASKKKCGGNQLI